MNDFIYSVNATIPIFLMILIGKGLKNTNIINDSFVASANKYVYQIGLPLLLFQDLANANFRDKFDLRFFLFCMLTTITFFIVIWILTELFMTDDTMKGAFVQSSCRSSAAILGLAFIQNMYQDTGMAPIMIVAAVPLFNIFSVTILTFKAKGRSKDNQIKNALINILKNPIILAIFIGLFFSVFDLPIPVIGQKTISNLAVLATPLALMAIGAGFEGRKAITKIRPTLLATFIKLILLPCIFLPIAIAMGFRRQELVAILIMLASPTTATSYIMAKNLDNDYVLTSSVIVLTTLLSAVTLTLFIFFLKSMQYI